MKFNLNPSRSFGDETYRRTETMLPHAAFILHSLCKQRIGLQITCFIKKSAPGWRQCNVKTTTKNNNTHISKVDELSNKSSIRALELQGNDVLTHVCSYRFLKNVTALQKEKNIRL